MKEHHTKEKGDIGVKAVDFDLTKKGFKTFSSNSEHLPFDIVAYKNKRFVRIQVKYRAMDNGTVEVSGRTSYADKNGTHSSFYDKDEVDYYAVYCPDVEKCYYVKPELVNSVLLLRIEAPKGAITKSMNFAKNFEDLEY